MKLKSNETGIRAMWKFRFGQARQADRRNPGYLDQRLDGVPELFRLVMQVRAETDPIIQAEVEVWERLNGKDHDAQGFVFDSEKYSHVYRTGTIEPDLAGENSPEWAMIQRVQKLAEDKQKEKIAEDFE